MVKGGSVSKAPLPFAFGLLAFALAIVVLGWGAMFMAGFLSRGLGLRLGLMASELALPLPALLAVAALRGTWSEGLGLRRVSARTVGLSLVAGAAFWCGSLGLFELQYTVWRPPLEYLEAFKRLHEALRPSGPIDALISVAAIAIAPAVFEELLFRGVVLPSLLRALGNWGAILGSALLFGMIHLDVSTPGGLFYRVPFAFAVGIGLGVLRVRTGSLFPSILAHALLNTITFVAEPLTEDPGAGLPDPRPLFGVAMLIPGLVVAALAMKRIDSPRPSP